MWACPHCGAPQAESARCWVCRRSSTTCSTCRHFRRALAGDLGYCGRDAQRRPLTGNDLRGCWQPRAEAGPANVLAKVLDEAQRVRADRAPVPAYRPGDATVGRDFVPIELVLGTQPAESAATAEVEAGQPHAEPDGAQLAPLGFIIETDERWAERSSLFGDAEG